MKKSFTYSLPCGDMFYMNDTNTIGSLTCSAPITAPNITDSGKLECGGGA